jgi:hypothetical protein
MTISLNSSSYAAGKTRQITSLFVKQSSRRRMAAAHAAPELADLGAQN